MEPSLAILIPTYARTAKLQEALWSALNQTVQVPIIVLNDCPQQFIECLHPLIRVVNLTERMPSLGAKRNALIDLAESEWVAWLDDDDWLLPWYVEDFVACMGQGVDTVLAKRCWYAAGGERDGNVVWEASTATMSLAVRTATARSIKGFPVDQDYGEDRVFVDKIISESRSCSLLEHSGYCCRWDNDVYHVSGMGEAPNPRERFVADADQRLLSGREPFGRVVIHPSFRHDYFRTCPDTRQATVMAATPEDIDPVVREIDVLPNMGIRLTYPRWVGNILDTVLSEYQETADPAATMSLSVDFQPATGRYTLSAGDGSRKEGVSLGELGQETVSFIYRILQSCHTGLMLDGGAVVDGDDALLLLGGAGTGKTFLIAWLLSRSFRFLADGLVLLEQEHGRVSGPCHPLRIRKSGADAFARSFPHLDYGAMGQAGFSCDLLPQRSMSMQPCASGTFAASLMVFVEYRQGTELSLDTLSAAQAALLLMGCVRNGKSLPGGGFALVSKTCKTIPALRLVYGDFAQLDGTLDRLWSILRGLKLSQSNIHRLLSSINRSNPLAEVVTKRKDQSLPHAAKEENPPAPAAAAVAMLEATPRSAEKLLTIGMATYDDYDGVFFTVQAIRLYHREILADIEILVVDNHPQGSCAASLKRLDSDIPGYRYVPESTKPGTAVRDLIFAEASGEFVLCMDCHVLIVPGALHRLLQYCKDNSCSRDLLQGPLIYNNLSSTSTHFQPVWRAGMYGVWGTDERGVDTDAEPFDIPMQGLGVFCCRKAVWPGFNPRFRGFGGEEGYLHEKFRQNDGRTLCLPFLRWLHRFDRPLGVPYKNIWEDRIYNYFVGFSELGMDTAPIEAHFAEHLGEKPAQKIFATIKKEMATPFFFFDAIYCIGLQKEVARRSAMERRFEALGIARRVVFFPAIETPGNHHIGCALSHRTIIAEGERRRLHNILVFEDDATFLDDTLYHLSRSIEELQRQDWHLFYLGGHRWGRTFPLAKGCTGLEIGQGITRTHALAYNASVFPRILAEVPETLEAMTAWIDRERGIDQYLRGMGKIFVASPVVASQPSILAGEGADSLSRFTLGEKLQALPMPRSGESPLADSVRVEVREGNACHARFSQPLQRFLAPFRSSLDRPLVSAMMVTKNRSELAKRALQCFLRQTYPVKELVILDDGEDLLLENVVRGLEDKRVKFFRIPSTGKTLGELRNAALALTRGEYVCQWDDDDISDPQRLEVQMAAILVHHVDACLLQRHIVWFPDAHRLAISEVRRWESSFVCRKSKVPAYPILSKGEDTPVIEEIAKGKYLWLDYPRLYVYVYHGKNTWDTSHFDVIWQASSRRFEGAAYDKIMVDLGLCSFDVKF
jgi:glycosyltransferase involved in cell wall biosynthesis